MQPATRVRPLEVSLKLSALGQALDRDGEKIAFANAHVICERAEQIGAWVTVDAEDHTTTDSTLSIAADLRADFPWLGVVLQAYLRRTHGRLRTVCRVRGQGPAVQRCLRRTRIGGLPGRRRGHRLLSALPRGADGRVGVPDGGLARPRRHRRGSRAGTPIRQRCRRFRVPDAVRHPRRRAAATRRRPATGSGCTCRSAPSGTGTSCGGWPSGRPT